jgi:hypothetical protein
LCAVQREIIPKHDALAGGGLVGSAAREPSFAQGGHGFMRKIVLVYGFLSGAVAAALMLATLPFLHQLKGGGGYVVGYTGIVLSALLIFFGVRSYRENVGGGTITFGRGFQVGILIALISSACYVATWELIYFKLAPDICDKMFSGQIEEIKASGASPHTIEEKTKQIEAAKRIYDNPIANAAVTFVEPFPVGLLITLVSAGVLRRKP